MVCTGKEEGERRSVHLQPSVTVMGEGSCEKEEEEENVNSGVEGRVGWYLWRDEEGATLDLPDASKATALEGGVGDFWAVIVVELGGRCQTSDAQRRGMIESMEGIVRSGLS